MVDSGTSHGPTRFRMPKGNAGMNVNKKGFSDHFPVSMLLEGD